MNTTTEITGEMLLEAMDKARPAVLSRLHNTADTEDCLQDACVNALRAASSFRGDSKFSTWFTRIAVNLALERCRRGKNPLNRNMRYVEDLDRLHRDTLNPEQIFVAKCNNARLKSALLELYPTYRRAILLWSTDMHPKDNVNTDKVRRHWAKAALRETLG